MNELQQQKLTRALDELKKARAELRAKIGTLGKDAIDVLKDGEDLIRFIETKLNDIGEAAVKDAQVAVAIVREKALMVQKEIEKRTARRPPMEAPPVDPAIAKN